MVRELIHALLTYSRRNLYQSCARNKHALISLVNRPCEPWQNQILKFVHLLGNWTPCSLTRAPPLPRGEARLGALVERRGGSWSAHGDGELLCPGYMLGTCHLLQAPPWYQSAWAQFLTVLPLPSSWGAGWSQHLGQTLKTEIPKISCWPFAAFPVYSCLNKWQILAFMGKNCEATLPK